MPVFKALIYNGHFCYSFDRYFIASFSSECKAYFPALPLLYLKNTSLKSPLKHFLFSLPCVSSYSSLTTRITAIKKNLTMKRAAFPKLKKIMITWVGPLFCLFTMQSRTKSDRFFRNIFACQYHGNNSRAVKLNASDFSKHIANTMFFSIF